MLSCSADDSQPDFVEHCLGHLSFLEDTMHSFVSTFILLSNFYSYNYKDRVLRRRFKQSFRSVKSKTRPVAH